MKTTSLLKILVILLMIFFICLLNIRLLGITNPFTNKDYIVKTYEGKNGNIKYPYFKDYGLDKKIKEYVLDLSKENGNIEFQLNIVDHKYLSILFSLSNYKYKSYIINLNNLKEEEISVIFIKNGLKEYGLKTKEMLELKYPAFIYDSIYNNQGEISYLIKDNEIIVYFSNYDIKPSVNEPIFVRLNYHEIYKYLKIDYVLDENYINDNIYALNPNKKTIAITFDDGPSEVTKDILNTLKDNKTTATFFMLGNRLEKNADIVNMVLVSDNEVGTHSYYHKYLTRLSKKKRTESINKPTEVMEELFNIRPIYFRPPYGNLTPKIKSEINMPIILWDVDPEDWHYRNAETIKNNVLSVIKDGDIVLLHDIFPTTGEALKLLLPELYVRGYQVVSVSKLAEFKGVTLEASKAYRSIK